MASDLRLRVATFTSTITFAKTDAEVGNILKWFVADKVTPPAAGLTAAELNQYYLDAARDELVRYVRQEARKNRLAELKAAQASIEDAATADTTL